MSATEKADAFDRLVREIRYRKPSVELAFSERGGGWRSGGPKGDDIQRFLAAFDVLTDRYKQHQLDGDRRLLKRLRSDL